MTAFSRRLATMMLAGLTLLILAAGMGCGGGGGGSSSGGGGGAASATVGVFFADNLSAGYDNVWVTAYKVELYNGATSVTVFDNPAGEEIDLRALGTPAGSQFLFLGPGSVPVGTYTKVEVTLARNVNLFPTGATTATVASFPPALNSGVNSKLELPLAPAFNVTGSGQNLIVDFDLPNWTLAGGIVTPALLRHNGGGLDDLNRHEDDDYKGTVSGLTGTAPNQSFVLSRLGRQIQVVCTEATQIFREEGAAGAALANGQLVEVRGVFDVLAMTIRARAVKIEDGEDEDDDKVKGTVKEASQEAGIFVVSTERTRGFIPTQDRVRVATTATTKYLNNAGTIITKEAFFTAINTAGARAEAEGVYTSANNTLTAAKVKLENEDDANEAETRGVVNTVNVGDGFVVIDAAGSETEGFTLPDGGQVKLQSKASTTYKNASGATITKAQFFELVKVGMTVKGNGTYSAGVLTCRKMEIRD